MTAPTDTPLQVEGFFDAATATVSYLVLDRTTRHCAVVDSVLDFDPKSGRTSTAGAEFGDAGQQALGATVQWILETHVHADR
jgi:glyoxylase-like metal-dependent hydrolase (beta-lactamase superfamily II)